MKKTRQMAAMAAMIVSVVIASGGAQAQNVPMQTWQPPKQSELDPAKRVPAAVQPTTDAQTQTIAPSQPTAVQPQQDDATPTRYEANRGGAFLGVQGGKGWVYEDVDQSARMLSAGYRWQAGAVTLVGIEAAAGRLDATTHEGFQFGRVDFASVGANARFNFGRDNPIFALVRAGYWSAEDNDFGDSADGAYIGVGLGVDFSRNVNMSLVYTNHVYFTDYYWEGDDFYYDINRADTLMLGAEVRF
jgi:hypothetical protein